MSRPRPIVLSNKALVASKRGQFDRRSALGRSVSDFVKLVKQPFGDAWSDLMEARLVVAYPWLVMHFSLPPLASKDGALHLVDAWRKANYNCQQLLLDLQRLSEIKPGEKKIKDLQTYLQTNYGEKR